jgi:CHAT domain-containing protein
MLGLDLRGTRLLVLSACDTGIGEIAPGEGVYGLRRAAVIAGAESQLVSLWKVNDLATRDLMAGYYQRLGKGENRSRALRNTQVEMLRSRQWSHPYYWASFIPIGAWGPLEQAKVADPSRDGTLISDTLAPESERARGKNGRADPTISPQ